MAVVIETTLGDLTVDLFIEERPRACQNFLKLCKLKYYNLNLFHNIEHGFIAQTGDPTGAGDGGESIWGVVEGSHKRYFEAENIPKIKHDVPGLLSMVSVGKFMVGSQFFFTLGSDLFSLDGVHCVIGEVTEGIDILRKLNEAIVDEKYRPFQDIRITHTVILEDPFDDPRGFQIPSRSPSPSAERLKNGRIGADEDIDDTEGKSAREIQEMLQEREAKARAIILEIVGDLPDAEVAPPENVLFVCKLNPVTTDDDLEIIFSRFGKVKSCEVIRDKISGDSLQYAFVEFEDKKACENAYFKMDNVLIDDRRIHVDFSQSVAKVKWRGKGRGIVREDGKEGGKIDFNDLRQKDKPKVDKNRRDASRERIKDRKDERSPKKQKSMSRSSSPERNRSSRRSRSRTPSERERRKSNQSSNPFSGDRRERRRSRSRSASRDNNRFQNRDFRRYDNYNRYNQRPYQNRGRGRMQWNRYNYGRQEVRRYDRRSYSRSPQRNDRHRSRTPPRASNNWHSSRPRDDQYNNYNSRQPQRVDRHREYQSNVSQRDDRRRGDDDRYRTNDNRSYDRNKVENPTKKPNDESNSSKRKQNQSSSDSKKKKSKSRKRESSTSSSEESSESTSTDSSSSEDRRRKKKNTSSNSKKKSRNRTSTSESSSSSDSSSS